MILKKFHLLTNLVSIVCVVGAAIKLWLMKKHKICYLIKELCNKRKRDDVKEIAKNKYIKINSAINAI